MTKIVDINGSNNFQVPFLPRKDYKEMVNLTAT